MEIATRLINVYSFDILERHSLAPRAGEETLARIDQRCIVLALSVCRCLSSLLSFFFFFFSVLPRCLNVERRCQMTLVSNEKAFFHFLCLLEIIEMTTWATPFQSNSAEQKDSSVLAQVELAKKRFVLPGVDVVTGAL